MKVKFVNLSIILLLIVFTTLATSCEKDEEFKAKIVIINNSESGITQFTLVGLSKMIDTLKPEEKYIFQHEWIGKHKQLFGSTDNSHLPLIVEYIVKTSEVEQSNQKYFNKST